MQTRREVLAAFAASVTVACAEVRPNFSGHWQVDSQRSTFNVPLDFTEVINHQEPSIQIDTTFDISQPVGMAIASLLAPKLRLSTTEAQDTNSMPMGLSLVSKSHWQGDRLLTEWKLSGLQSGDQEGAWTRYLSEGGKTMTVEFVAESGGAKVQNKLVLVKKG